MAGWVCALISIAACAGGDELDEDNGAAGLALDGSRQVTAPEDVRGVPAVVAHWIVPTETVGESSRPLTLRIWNTSEFELHFSPKVETLGLRRLRTEILAGPLALAPGAKLDLAWVPARSPLQPIGSSIEITARLDYELRVRSSAESEETVTGTISSEHFFASYSDDLTQVFLSRDDDLSVRLSALGTTSEAGRVDPSQSIATRLAAVLDASEFVRGKVDGVAVAAAKPLSPAEEAHSDTLRLEGEWESALPAAQREQAQLSGGSESLAEAAGSVTLPPCGVMNAYLGFRNLCVEWRSSLMFNDSGVSSSIPQEDQLIGNQRTPYVWAEVSG